jgi:hypothetical protein
VPAVGEGTGADADGAGDVTGGADGSDGDPLIGSVGIADTELAGAAAAPVTCVLAGADDGASDTAPTRLR